MRLILVFLCLTLIPVPAPADTLPEPFVPASIDFLATRKFKPSPFQIVKDISDSSAIHVFSVRYPSDQFTVAALLVMPKNRPGPFPGIVVCHGFYPPDSYKQGLGTLDTAEALAAEGFAVLLPDYRGYPPSNGGHDYPYPGELVDVLNGFSSLAMHAKIDAGKMAVIGYSWGSGFAVSAAEILGKRVKALVNYYGNLGGYSLRRDEAVALINNGILLDDMHAIFKSRSPFHHIRRIHCPTLMFHGQIDTTVPIDQSVMLAKLLQNAGKPVELVSYPDLGHAFGDSHRNPSFPKLVAFLNKSLSRE